MIELKEISISEIKKTGIPDGTHRDGHYDHPLLKEDIFYLAKIDGRWYAGTFSKQRYGWNFNAIYDAGCQLSCGRHPIREGWEQLYIIVDKSIKAYPLILDVLKEELHLKDR